MEKKAGMVEVDSKVKREKCERDFFQTKKSEKV